MNSSKWYFNSIFYQIYPQSFQDSNGDGIGDLEGIIFRLDYLQSLGIDAIWLNPVYPSPFKDAGYDVADYKNIAPRYGNLATFDRLIKEAHKKNIKIIMDIVFNHTSNKHPWFRNSQKMQKNRYSKWYVWCDSFKPIDLGSGSWAMWTAERYESYYHQFTFHQPDLNFGFPDLPKEYGNSYDDPDIKALREELKSTVRFWLDGGADGFRVDVAEWLVQESGKKGLHKYTVRFWNEVRKVIDSYGDKAFIAEGVSHHVDDIVKCKFNGCFFIPQTARLLSSHPKTLEGKLSPGKFFSPEGGDLTWFIEEYLEEYNQAIKGGGIINMISGNHDTPRMSSICQKDEIIKTYFAMLLTYPTTPFIYYGDEIGMRHWENLPSREGANFRSGSRTPMQWNSRKNAGFSSADSSKIYFPLNKDYPERNVEKQEHSSDSILNTMRKLIKLRKSNPSLGPFADIHHLHLKKGDKSYIYSRYGKGDAFLIALNPSDTSRNLTIKLGPEKEFKRGKYLLPEVCSQETSKIPIKGKLSFQLPANFFAIYRVI
ncbi:glycosylase [Patescibacteria group bacterium]|nr:glycosylase [Patescibacteria group bacterium]